MRDVVIAQYLRTAQSRSRPKDPGRDWFGKLRPDDMVANLLPEVVERAGLTAGDIDDFILGCAQTVLEQSPLGGRIALMLANMDKRTSAKCIDEQCGSTIAAMQMAYMEIAMGYADIVLCGGTEHMTRVPMGGDGAIEMNLRFYSDPSLKHWDITGTMNMGLCAEKLAEESGISREEQDAWGARSHQLAHQAQQDGFFDGEILPLEVEQADGSTMVVDKDQAIRPDATVEGMANLRALFKKNGCITAGNASPLNAGASCVLLMSKETAEAKGIKPMATIRSIGFAGVEPNNMGKGPVPASLKALKSAGLEIEDIDLWEINEAFAAVPLYAIKELGLNPEKVNVRGGGIAIGHPLGASGGRITGTLARLLEERNLRYGCATMCCGGGQGVAIIIERERD